MDHRYHCVVDGKSLTSLFPFSGEGKFVTLKDVTHDPIGLPDVVMQTYTCMYVCTLLVFMCACVLLRVDHLLRAQGLSVTASLGPAFLTVGLVLFDEVVKFS